MIDVMIITYNERVNLPISLAALQGWVHRVFVIDSGSTDGTPDIARQYGVQVVQHAWGGYAAQKNWGLANLPFESPWTLIIDADEVITHALRERLQQLTERPAQTVLENGFFINRLTCFLGQPIHHCGYFPSWNLRLFKRGLGRYEDRAVHEHVVIDSPLGYIHEPMLHYDRRSLEHFIAKHNRYSTLESRHLFSDIVQGDKSGDQAANLSRQTMRRRWLKRTFMHKVPLPGLWRFLYMYVARLGMLDGRAGFDFCRFIASYDAMVALKLRWLIREHRASGGEVDLTDAQSGLAIAEGSEAPHEVISHTTVRDAADSPHHKTRVDDGDVVDGGGGGDDDVLSPAQMRPEASPWSLREKVLRAIWMLAGRPLFRASFHNWYGLRASMLRLFGAKIGTGVAIRPSVNIEIPWMLHIEDDATIGDNAILYCLGKIHIGKRSIISQYAHLCAGTHDYADHTFRLMRPPITIGHDVWIGTDVFVGPNVTVGDLAVVGARSSVYRDLPAGQVCVGNPARPLKERKLK